jgi:hypothetical protein
MVFLLVVSTPTVPSTVGDVTVFTAVQFIKTFSLMCATFRSPVLSPVNIHNNLTVVFCRNIKEIGGTIYGNYSWR